MRINYTERNYTASPKLSGIIDKKLSKLDKYFDDSASAGVTLAQEKLQCVMEVTISYNGIFFRSQRRGAEMYSLIDEIEEILDRKIRRHRTRLEKRLKADAFVGESFEDDTQNEYDVVRTKRFPVKPMDVKEAIMQMDLLGHDFFVFTNCDTNQANIVYRNKEGKINLIEPEFEE